MPYRDLWGWCSGTAGRFGLAIPVDMPQNPLRGWWGGTANFIKSLLQLFPCLGRELKYGRLSKLKEVTKGDRKIYLVLEGLKNNDYL